MKVNIRKKTSPLPVILLLGASVGVFCTVAATVLKKKRMDLTRKHANPPSSQTERRSDKSTGTAYSAKEPYETG